MLNCEAVEGRVEHEVSGEGLPQPGVFALMLSFYAAARAQQDRRVLRDMLGQIIDGLRDQFDTERRLRRRVPRSVREARERMSSRVLAELQEFLDRAESEDEPVTMLTHALDGLVVRQVRGELQLRS